MAIARNRPTAPSVERVPSSQKKGDVREAVRAYLIRSAASNVRQALNDKISRLRQFFGSDFLDEVDPRPAEHRRHAKKRDKIPPWFSGRHLSEITPDLLLSFLVSRNYGRSSKRHFREVFHGLFRSALVNGIHVPANPYAPNPADELPGYVGRDKPVTVLSADDITAQYRTVASDRQILFGCQLMIEAGFRLHEILALRREQRHHSARPNFSGRGL